MAQAYRTIIILIAHCFASGTQAARLLNLPTSRNPGGEGLLVPWWGSEETDGGVADRGDWDGVTFPDPSSALGA